MLPGGPCCGMLRAAWGTSRRGPTCTRRIDPTCRGRCPTPAARSNLDSSRLPGVAARQRGRPQGTPLRPGHAGTVTHAARWPMLRAAWEIHPRPIPRCTQRGPPNSKHRSTLTPESPNLSRRAQPCHSEHRPVTPSPVTHRPVTPSAARSLRCPTPHAPNREVGAVREPPYTRLAEPTGRPAPCHTDQLSCKASSSPSTS